MASHGRARRHIAVLASYTLLSLILTYPLALHFTTYVPGDGIDDPALAWNLWWVRYSLLERLGNPFDCRWMFWPIGINLAFYTLTVLNGLLSVPLQLAFDLVPASNVLLLSSFVLGGYGTYLLTWQVWSKTSHGKDDGLWAAAWLAGLIYAFASNKLFYAALGQFNIASSQWIPFCVLYVWRAGQRQGSPRDAALAGLFLGLQAWAEATFASFLLIFIGLYALWIAITRPRPMEWIPTGCRIALTLAIFAVAIIPMLANMIPDLRTEGDFMTSGGGFADVFSADLAGYLVPTMHHPLLGSLTGRMPFPHDKGQHIYLGYSVMLLCLVGALTSPRRYVLLWGGAGIVFWLLTLGPTLRVMEYDTGIPGPFALVAQLPFFKGNRYPSRYVVMLLLSASVLAAQGFRNLWTRRTRGRRRNRRGASLRMRALLGGISLIFLFEHLSIPLPLSDMRVPAIYQRIARENDPTPGALLELPLGWRNGARVVGKKDVIIMFEQWYQMAHHRPILGGNTSRNPEFKFQYFSEAPLLDVLITMINAADEPFHQTLRSELSRLETWLARPDQAPPGWLADQRRQAAEVLRFLDVAYVMIHRDRVPPLLEQFVLAVFPLEPVAEERDIALYRVRRDEASMPSEVDLTEGIGRLFLGEGWSPPARPTEVPLIKAVWAQRHEVRLLLPETATLRGFELLAYAPGPGQTVSLIVDGQEVARAPVPQRWEWIRFSWSPPEDAEGVLPVRLRFDRLYRLDEVRDDPYLFPSDARPGPALLIRSAGEEVGDFAHIYVNGVDRSPNARGYNLVLLDPDTGQVLDAAAFDTHADAQASQAMAAWLRAIPRGAWVLGAVKDEASLNLTEDAVMALREIGVATDLRGRFRWSHAFIGVKGAAPGEAQELLSAFRPASLTTAAPLSRPQVASGVAALRLIQQDGP